MNVSEKKIQLLKVKTDNSKSPVPKGDWVYLVDNQLVRYAGK
ncbi:MAG TPA: hypothetical protein PLD80_07210 [Rugosibacter sp.]|nr:hypothetical protein [Rugosibacter sp.]